MPSGRRRVGRRARRLNETIACGRAAPTQFERAPSSAGVAPAVYAEPRRDRKGIGLIFPNRVAEIGPSGPSAATQPNSETPASIPGRVLFSLLGADSLELACPAIGTLHP